MKIRLVFLLAILTSAVELQSATPAVILPDGRRMEGTEVRATREGVVYLTTQAGRVEYPKGTKVVMDQPADLVKAGELVSKKQFAEAVPVLEKLAEELRFLGWDVKARKLLAQGYAGKGEWKKAVEAYEALTADFKEMQADEEVRAGYLRALASAGETEKVLPLLEGAIRKGTRGEAAQAQLIRAKAKLEAGDVEGALYDFMRNARYFKEFKDESSESAFRAAECLEKLGSAEQAAVYYKQVVQEFPESGVAAQAKAKVGTP